MWYTSSSGRIELNIPKRVAFDCYHQGDCAPSVRWARDNEKRVERQLRKVDPEALREELRGYGAWDEDELADHETNLDRLLWLACGDIVEEMWNNG